jgi:Protein of unknown function (DUF664)
LADGGSKHQSVEVATRAALVRSLDAQREHALGILEGLSVAQLKQPRLPSGWSCLGLINHLALDVERYWFTCVIGGEPFEATAAGDDDATRAWRVGPDADAEEILARYRSEIVASNQVIANAGLDDPPAQRDAWWGEWEVPDVRFVLLHVIAETACHAGHLDAARELTDGRLWISL